MKNILKNQIERFYNESGIKLDTESEKFEYFCAHTIIKGVESNESQIISSITDGSYDEGIDSIFVIIDNKLYSDKELACENIRRSSKINFIFAQMKKEENFSETVLIKIQKGLKYSFENNTNLSNQLFKKQTELLKAVWDKHVEIACEKKINVDVYCIIEANSGIQALENQRIVREVEEINKIVQSFGFISKVNLWGCKELIEISNKHNEYRKALPIIDSFDYPENEDDLITGYIAIVDGYDYFKYITNENFEIEDKIFEENIRDYQGEQGVNIKISNTLKSPEKRNFWCMNNGITMIGYKKDKRGKNIWLSDYQIINGCQTSYSIYNYMKSLSEEERTKVTFEVIVKIIEITESNEELLLKIIDSTNSQTGLDAYAFESHKSVHRLIEQYLLAKDPKFYYERRPNSYARKNVHPSFITNPQKLLQTMYSIYFKKPSEARNSPGALFAEKKNEIFKEENSYEFYWIACNLFKATDDALANFNSSSLNDIGSYIYKNGIYHILRVVFSLVMEKEIKMINKLNTKDIYDQLGENIEKLMDKDLNVLSYIDTSINIIEKALRNKLVADGKNISNVFRTSEFDDEITKQTALFINERIRTAAVNEAAVTEEKKYNMGRVKHFMEILDYYRYCFELMSYNGDFRFNFGERLNDLVYWTSYYKDLTDTNEIIINRFNEIKSSVEENKRDSRRTNASEIYNTIIGMRNNIYKDTK